MDLSYPEPATYFDIRSYLVDLISPPPIEFEKKLSNVVWIVSNCNAFNGREKLIKKLMNYIDIDSYGECLRNRFNLSREHMQGNIELYSKYKFVIAIENSNCHDYVTEKLVHAVASGSIPIVAGRDGKPDYLRYMPTNSYINVYDFKTIEDFVKKIKLISENKIEYEKYIYFKRNHNLTRKFLKTLSLKVLIDLTRKIIKKSDTFFQQLIFKEKSDNKYCKLAWYIKNTPKEVLENDIRKMKINRPDSNAVCLNRNDLNNNFASLIKN